MGTRVYQRDSYNKEILSISCPFCKAQPAERCHPVSGVGTTAPYPPHKQRIKAAEKKISDDSEIQKLYLARHHVKILQEFLDSSGYVLCAIQSNTGDYYPVDKEEAILRFIGIDTEKLNDQRQKLVTHVLDERAHLFHERSSHEGHVDDLCTNR